MHVLRIEQGTVRRAVLQSTGPLRHTQGQNTARAMAYGSAMHYMASATRGKTRTFVGLYSFELEYTTVNVRGARYVILG